MIKFRPYYDKDKETEFLNEMSRRGYALTGFFAGFCSFDSCKPGEYIYQVDITEGLFRVCNDYREFMRDMNVEIVSLWGPWVTLRKKAEEGPFLLYTDVESNIEHYTKIRNKFKIAATVEAICLFIEVLAALRGSHVAKGFSCILAAILAGMLREVARVNGIIAELQERSGTGAAETGRRIKGRLSRFVALGFLLNAIGFLVSNTGYRLPGDIAAIPMTLQSWAEWCHLLAIVFFVIGFVRTLLRYRE